MTCCCGERRPSTTRTTRTRPAPTGPWWDIAVDRDGIAVIETPGCVVDADLTRLDGLRSYRDQAAEVLRARAGADIVAAAHLREQGGRLLAAADALWRGLGRR